MKRHFFGLITGIFLIVGVPVYGQIGHGTSDPSKASVIEMLSPSKGLLIPRVELTSLTDFAPIAGESSTSVTKANSLLVYNTTPPEESSGELTPGYYYWTTADQRWNRLINDADIAALGLSVTADNGLTIAGDNIRLGGALVTPTSIETDATNTIALEGLQTGATTDRIVVADPTSGVLKQLKAAMPKFFYMPSIIIPTDAGHIPAEYDSPTYMTFVDDGTTKTGTIYLHAIYVAQFSGSMASSSTKSPEAGTLPVIPPNELNYYITWYDNTVFENVKVSNTGKLDYEVKVGASVDEGSFMNIVFEVRETPSSP